MSVLAPIKEEKQSQVHHSEYIHSEDDQVEETKPTEESNPAPSSEGDEQAKPAEPSTPKE